MNEAINSTGTKVIKILLIEDESSIRALLHYDLKNLGYEVFEAEDGETALTLVIENNFDVLLVDWMLPKISGIDLVKQLRAKNCPAIIIMLTAKDNEEDILQAFDCGVDDYLTKPFSPRELTARIAAHTKRFNKVGEISEIKTYGNLAVDSNRRTIKVNDSDIKLTRKEYELLICLLENNNIVLSRDQLLDKIWGYAYDGDTRIVDVHIFNLRNKLKDAALQIQANRGIGYILELI